jgi:putative two-component system response regulator
MRILVVAAEPALVDLVEQAALAADIGPFEIDSAALAVRDPGVLLAHDAILVAHAPPEVDGLDLIRRRGATRRDRPPIVLVAGPGDEDVKAAALEAGSDDVLIRPFTALEFERRVGNVLRQAALELSLDEKERWIAGQVASIRRELETFQEEIILRLCRAGGYRDHETGEHIIRMARYCKLIAQELGFPEETCRFIYNAAQMHDIGKIGIPDAILQKPGRLTAEERAVMEEHTVIGEAILQGSASPLIKAAEMIAATHHERWDGTGYPRGLKEDGIPIAGRIAAVADVFDALTSERPYKPGWPLAKARDEILRNRGAHFDPACVDAFLRRWDEVETIAQATPHRQAIETFQSFPSERAMTPASPTARFAVPSPPAPSAMNGAIAVP